MRSFDSEKINQLVGSLIAELEKSKKDLQGVGYITKLDELKTIYKKYELNPSDDLLKLIYNWILGGNAWPEGAYFPPNLPLIYKIMSEIRQEYEKLQELE